MSDVVPKIQIRTSLKLPDLVPSIQILSDGIQIAEMSTEAATAVGIGLIENVITSSFEAIIAKWLVARYDFDKDSIQDAMDDFRYFRDQMTGGKLFLDLSEMRKKAEEMCRCGHPRSAHKAYESHPEYDSCQGCYRCSKFTPLV